MRLLSAALAILACASAEAGVLRLGDAVVPVSQSVTLQLDPQKDDYRGSTTVELDVKVAAKGFRVHALGPRLTAVRVDNAPAAQAKGPEDTVEITPQAPLSPGRHTLVIDFEAPVGKQGVGLYKVVHEGEPYLYTQFEAIEARRAFPCWDEPTFKIPWQVTLVIPAALEAVSNTPIERTTTEGASHTVTFARTRPLPSYLIAVAVGRFDTLPIPGLKIPARIVAPRGEAHLGHVAAELTPPILAALEKYFGMPYPYEKLDLIAVPGFWYGAMENPGAITYKDTLLLVDEKAATPRQRSGLVITLAHELAHQWFGDLVTMAWWDDFWLNESFGQWMAVKIAGEVHPELRKDPVAFAQDAMNTDARPSTIAIRQVGIAPDEAMRTVVNVYAKGTGVLNMFEASVGVDRFRDGLNAYLQKHAWGNADTPAFFATVAAKAPPGIAEAMQGFVTQPGVPLVTVERAGPRTLRLTQRRFLATGKAPPLQWRIPVTLRLGDAQGSRTLDVMLDGATRTVELPGEPSWIFPHAEGAGYYRWRLPPAELAALPPAALSPRERLALLGNVEALWGAGLLGSDVFLDVLDRFVREEDPLVLARLVDIAGSLAATFDDTRLHAALAAYLQRLLGPALRRIGLEPREGQAFAVAALRPDLLYTLALRADDPDARVRAGELATRWLADPASVPAALAGTVLAIQAHEGDLALFEELRRRYEAAATPADKSMLLKALAHFSRPEVRARALDYNLEGKVGPTDIFTIPRDGDLAVTDEDRERTWRWFVHNQSRLLDVVPRAFQPAIAGFAGGCDPGRLARARKLFAHVEIEGLGPALDRVAEQTAECATLRARERGRLLARLRRGS